MMKKLCIVVILYMVLASWIGLWGDCPSGNGNVCSKATGYWSDYNTWDIGCDGPSNDGSIPVSTDNVCIESGHSVTLNTNSTISDLTVFGTLNLGNTSNVLTVNGNITINSDGTLVKTNNTYSGSDVVLNFYYSACPGCPGSCTELELVELL